jgi:hypothetical protein
MSLKCAYSSQAPTDRAGHLLSRLVDGTPKVLERTHNEELRCTRVSTGPFESLFPTRHPLSTPIKPALLIGSSQTLDEYLSIQLYDKFIAVKHEIHSTCTQFLETKYRSKCRPRIPTFAFEHIPSNTKTSLSWRKKNRH